MITTVTLNASIDKAYTLTEQLTAGQVMRVASVQNSAGGKGLNVSRVVQLCGHDVLATGLVGGFNGAYLLDLLQKDGIASSFTKVAGETRSCINVLDSRFGSTEFLEPGFTVSPDEEKAFVSHFESLLAETEVVTLSGSLPQGMSHRIYARLIDLAKKAGKQVILDSSGQSFVEGLKAKPTLVKPNKDEIEALFGVTLTNLDETLHYAKKIAEHGIDYVVVSLGGDGAVLLHDGKVYHGRPPQITPVNTVGCGDSMVAALATRLAQKASPQECLRYAIAIGTANALSERTGYFEQPDVDWIYPLVAIEELA